MQKKQWKQKQIELNSDMKSRECVSYSLDFNLKKKLWWRWRRELNLKKKKKNNDNKSNNDDDDDEKNDLRNMV